MRRKRDKLGWFLPKTPPKLIQKKEVKQEIYSSSRIFEDESQAIINCESPKYNFFEIDIKE